MVKVLATFLLMLSVMVAGNVVASQNCATTDGVTTCVYNIPDDGHAIVPIPFGFPFYGQVFTHSIFFDNGAVSFYSPTMPQRMGPSWFGGITINENISSSFFYSIVPLGTDLIANTGRHFTQGNENFLTYNWEDVSQFGRWDSRNTFSVEIRPTGFIGINYDRVDITNGFVSGIIGDARLGEFIAIDSAPWGTPVTSLNNWSIAGTESACVDPLVSSNCPGYADAYLTQQCSITALYDPACPGHSVAYLDFQCSLDPLYSTTCSGYDTAYFTQQCTLDPLYNEQCPGYDDAYYVQQCTLNPLYDRGCTDYEIEYAKQNLLSTPEPVEVIIAQVEPEPTPAPAASPAEVTAVVQLAPQPTQELSNATSPSSSSSSTTTTAAPATETKSGPRTTRQALAERRLAALLAKAVEDGKKSVEEMDSATTMEQQMEVQNAVLAAMAFVPGFDVYNQSVVPDGVGYKPFTIYDNQRNIDTPAARRLLGGSDRLHREMVDAQYR